MKVTLGIIIGIAICFSFYAIANQTPYSRNTQTLRVGGYVTSPQYDIDFDWTDFKRAWK